MFAEIFLLRLRRQVIEQHRDGGWTDEGGSTGASRPEATAGVFTRPIVRRAELQPANEHEPGAALLPPEPPEDLGGVLGRDSEVSPPLIPNSDETSRRVSGIDQVE